MPDPWTHALPTTPRAVGTGDPPNDENANVDALTAMGAGFDVLNPALGGGADPTGTSDSAAAFNAAIAALPAGGGAIRVPSGTYKLASTAGPLSTNQWILCDPGVRFNFTGTGDCFRWVDASTYTARTMQGGGLLGRPLIDGSGDGAGSTAIHAGDILGLQFDANIQNFSKSGDISTFWDNQNYWAEQAIARFRVDNCSSVAKFSCGGALTSAGSFDRGLLTYYVSVKTFSDDIFTWQNGARQAGGAFSVFGNINSSGSAVSHSIFNFNGSVPAGHPGAGTQFSSIADTFINVNVESDLGLANNYQTINFGSTSNGILNSGGVLSFAEAGGSVFAASNISAPATQFTFNGPVVGDTTLATNIYSNRQTYNGQTFYFSPMQMNSDIAFLPIGVVPGTPGSGVAVYVDPADGKLKAKGASGTVTILAVP